jgi:threonine/homoserine/homoserine lactone efflux protein
MSESAARPDRKLLAIRLAILATALALVLGLALLIHEDPYVFTAFMVLGPLLLAAAFLLLGWTILQELRAKTIL